MTDIVYAAMRHGGSRIQAYHEDKDCWRLRNARKTRAQERIHAELSGKQPCGECCS